MTEGYTQSQVEILIGLRTSRKGERITILDILSWASDAGGDTYWQKLAQENYPAEAWTARRGPLSPDSILACTLWDWRIGMKKLDLTEQAVVGLLVLGFNRTEISSVIDVTPREINRVLFGRARRDGEGKLVRNDQGKPVYDDGAVTKLAKGMNGIG